MHSLEHGAVWVTYRPELSTEDVEALRAQIRGKRYTLLSPYAGLPAPVVASAWGVQLQLSGPDDPRLESFLATYRQGPQAPEPGAACYSGTTFTFLLGLSLWLVATRLPRRELWRSTVRRSITLIALALLITAGTYVFVGEAYVRFGILHLLGSMLVLSLPLLTAPLWVTLSVGLAMILVGAYLTTLTVIFPWLIALGVAQAGVEMVDYYPLLPWGGAALLGVACGRLSYPGGRRRVALPDFSAVAPLRALRFLGRNSLLVYVLHQPILLGTLFALQALR